jgi:uncharacterized protein YdaU (DUF1376 family)
MKYQFMPMFWGDFFANTLHLTTQEVGAYVLLIGHAWEHNGKIAVQDLQRVARVSNRNWHRVRHRVTPFFDTLSDATSWTSERVLLELTKAAEISSKRKDAAEQMHSKSRAKALQAPPHLPSYLPVENLNLGKAGEPSSVQMQVDFHDKGNAYRSPPRTKSDNVLEPVPERPPPRRVP